MQIQPLEIKYFHILDWILRYTLFHGFDTFGSHLREEGSLHYNGGLVRLWVQMKLDMHLHRRQAPFSGAIAREQVIKTQSSLRLWIFLVFLLIFLLHLLDFDHPQNKNNQFRVLLNPSFILVPFLYLLTLTGDGRLHLQQKNIYFVDGLENFCRQRWHATQDLKAEAKEHLNLQEKLHL
jgi:hypothetical protein